MPFTKRNIWKNITCGYSVINIRISPCHNFRIQHIQFLECSHLADKGKVCAIELSGKCQFGDAVLLVSHQFGKHSCCGHCVVLCTTECGQQHKECYQPTFCISIAIFHHNHSPFHYISGETLSSSPGTGSIGVVTVTTSP